MKGLRIGDPNKVRDLASFALESPGRPKIIPAELYEGTTTAERALFGQRHGIYGFPTTELISWLGEFIAGRDAIEIGAGHGGLAEALGIKATDNYQQTFPDVKAIYDMTRQPVVTYGTNVERLPAAEAVRKYRPKVVVASWVTHLYQEARHDLGGNMHGVDESDVIQNCDAYVFIGNREVHGLKPIWRRRSEVIEPKWLYSRAHNGTPDFIAVWKR